MERRRFRFDKLVRDGIPQILAAKGMDVELAIPEDALLALKTKLGEEALELMACTTPADMHEELADVLEVLHAICERTGLSWQHLDAIRQQKRVKKGGFSELAYINTVELDAQNPEIQLFLDNPLEFPEEQT